MPLLLCFMSCFSGALEASELFILVLLANKLRQTMTDIQIYAELCAISSGDVFSWLFSPSLSVSVVSQRLLTDYFLFFLTSAALKKIDYLQVFRSWEEKKVTFVCLLSVFATVLLMFPLGRADAQLRNEIEIVFKDITLDSLVKNGMRKNGDHSHACKVNMML